MLSLAHTHHYAYILRRFQQYQDATCEEEGEFDDEDEEEEEEGQGGGGARPHRRAPPSGPREREHGEKPQGDREELVVMPLVGDRRRQVSEHFSLSCSRVYAHRRRWRRDKTSRSDFTDTVYWAAAVRTNSSGQATFSFCLNYLLPTTYYVLLTTHYLLQATFTFCLSDTIGSFRALAEGFVGAGPLTGALGSSQLVMTSRLPFHIGFRLPFELTTGDTLCIPVVLANNSEDDLTAQLQLTHLDAGLRSNDSAGMGIRTIDLLPGQRARHVVGLAVSLPSGREERWMERARVALSAVTDDGEHEDTVKQRTRLAPAGFPSFWLAAGCLMAGRVTSLTLVVPPLSSPGVDTTIHVHTSAASCLEEALDGLAALPLGCFEQRCSSIWPAVWLLRRASSGAAISPALLRRASAIASSGWKGLEAYACPDGGFDWFPRPGMSARPELTAYGLLLLHELRSLGVLPPTGCDLIGKSVSALLRQRLPEGRGFIDPSYKWLRAP